MGRIGGGRSGTTAWAPAGSRVGVGGWVGGGRHGARLVARPQRARRDQGVGPIFSTVSGGHPTDEVGAVRAQF